MPRAEDWRHVGWPYKVARPVARALHAAVRLGVEGVEHCPVDGEGVLLVANHHTNWDPLFIMERLPRPVNWLGQELVLRGSPVRRWFFREVGVVPVDRTKGQNVEAVAEAIRRYEEGRVVGIFPEGRESPDPLATLPPRSGVGRIALAVGARVLPCAIRAERFWPFEKRVPRFGGPSFVRFGPTFRVERDAAGARDPERARAATERIWARVLQMKRALDADVARRR